MQGASVLIVHFMAEVVPDAPQEFWRSPTVLEPVVEAPVPAATILFAEACANCGTEFMIGGRFCHTCGLRRPAVAPASMEAAIVAGLWPQSIVWLRSWPGLVAAAWHKISLPDWMQYLQFHEIKRWVGLPTAALIAFMIGLGCVAGALRSQPRSIKRQIWLSFRQSRRGGSNGCWPPRRRLWREYC
jgi:hypothetical protein